MSIAFATPDYAAVADRLLRVMVVDDAVVARSLVARWVDNEPDMKVVATLRTGREAVDQVEQADPDVVGEVLKLAEAEREPNPINLDRNLSRLAACVYRLDGQLLVVLDIDRVLDLGVEAAAA